MAEKLIKTRLKLKYDTFANWEKVKTTFVPLKGEVCLVEVPDAIDPIRNAPAVLSKVGDGATAFGDLKYASALAADVYSWAKASGITVSNSGTGDFVKSIAWTDNELVITKGNVPTPAAPGNGKLTITVGDDTTVFTANQATGSDVAITLGDVAKKNWTDLTAAFDPINAASTVKSALLGTTSDAATAETIRGAKKAAANAQSAAEAAQTAANGKTTLTQVNAAIDAKLAEHDGLDATGTVKSVILASGTSEGTLKLTVDGVAQDNVKVTGLAALAYKASLGKGDVGLGNVQNKGLDAAVTASSGNYITSGAVKTYVDEKVTGSVQYLGTVASATELAALNPDSAGDFCRVSTAFGSYHAGDLLLCKTVKSGDTAATWDVIHGEIDKNTWTANSASADGYVTKGSGQAYKVWKTDANGNPAWRADSDTNQKVKAGAVGFGDNDVIDIVAGENVTVTGDASAKSITIKAKDTTYGLANATVPGLVKSSATGTTSGRDYKVEVNADGTMKVNVPWTDTNTDTKVTSAANHYTPAADTSAALSASASSTTAATWNSTSLVTGVNLQRDAKGHVVGVSVNSIKMPANPNVTTTVSTTANGGLKVAKTNNNYKVDIDDAIIFVLDCGSSTEQI